LETIPRWSIARRKQFVRLGRKTRDLDTTVRYRLVAWMAGGMGVTTAARTVGCAISTASSARRRFLDGGAEGLLDRRAGNGSAKVTPRFLEVLRQVLRKVPQDFGWQRSTWSRELLTLELARRRQPLVAACTMGRALDSIGARLGAPKPYVDCPWPAQQRERRRGELRKLAAQATALEPVFYVDEVDIHLNPKVGRDWMLPGTRRYVRTPGQNKKHYLAGALNAQTRKVTWVDAARKTSALFCALVWRLAAQHPKARRLHLILDNFIIHKSKKTQAFMGQLGGRIVLHFLPPYCPDDNDIERLWLDVHSNVTRNHRCLTLKKLLRQVDNYLHARNATDGHQVGYRVPSAALAA
jgi:transposase